MQIHYCRQAQPGEDSEGQQLQWADHLRRLHGAHAQCRCVGACMSFCAVCRMPAPGWAVKRMLTDYVDAHRICVARQPHGECCKVTDQVTLLCEEYNVHAAASPQMCYTLKYPSFSLTCLLCSSAVCRQIPIILVKDAVATYTKVLWDSPTQLAVLPQQCLQQAAMIMSMLQHTVDVIQLCRWIACSMYDCGHSCQLHRAGDAQRLPAEHRVWCA